MTTEKNDGRPDCFGKLYDEKDCGECVFGQECKVITILPKSVDKEVDEDLEAAAAAALTAEVKEDDVIDLDTVATDLDTETATVKKAPATKAKKAAKAPATQKAAKAPAKKAKVVEVKNRKPFNELVESGRITPFVDDKTKKTYMQVDDDGVHVYKSQIYHEKNLAEYANSGTNPFKDGSIPAEAFNLLKKGNEITFRDAFKHLKSVFPGKKDATLMNRAADVLSGAHFFGIAKVTRKEGRQKFFQMQ